MSLCKSLFIGEIFMFPMRKHRFLNVEPYVSGSENVGFSMGKRRKCKGIL